jgi:hypothetical protein
MLHNVVSENPQILRFLNEWKGKRDLFIIFTIIAITAYGFELFNFNLTIDEELYAIGIGAPTNWIREGRWGMYLLQLFILPNPVVPFVPLGIALLFHILSILVLLDAWEVKSLWWQVLTGSLILTYPGWAYVYVFSSLSYGVGIGLFMIALSLWGYAHLENNWYKLFSFLPASFAFSLYQAMLPTFLLVFFVYFVLKNKRKTVITLFHLLQIFIITVLAMSTYYAVQQIFLKITDIQLSDYVENHFVSISDVANLNLHTVIEQIVHLYGGDKEIYTFNIFALPSLVFILLLAIVMNKYTKTLGSRILEFVLVVCILMFPVLPILLMNVVKIRFLMGLSFSIAALLVISVEGCKLQVFRWLVSLFAIFTILQFITSINQLFGATHITLQSDRVLAGQMIERIEMARSQSSQPDQVKYIEVIGNFQKVPTLVNPNPYNYEIIGKSVFEFNGGVSRRIVAFLKILSYDELQPLPLDRRSDFISTAMTMPVWPRIESVQVVNDTVLVKFGHYSEVQIMQICTSGLYITEEGFCP